MVRMEKGVKRNDLPWSIPVGASSLEHFPGTSHHHQRIWALAVHRRNREAWKARAPPRREKKEVKFMLTTAVLLK